VQGGDPLSRKGIQKVDTEGGQDEALKIMGLKEAATGMSTTTTMTMTMIIAIIGVRATKKMTMIINMAGTGGNRLTAAMMTKKTTMMTTTVVPVTTMMKKTMTTLTIAEAGHMVVPEVRVLLLCREKM
jgi:hypothetical protein